MLIALAVLKWPADHYRNRDKTCQWFSYRQGDAYIDDNRPVGIGGIIKAQRLARGMKQIPFAKAVGISQSALADIENDNTTNLRAVTLFKLADYLKLHPRYLLTQKGPEIWSATNTEQEARLLDAFRELQPEARAEVVGRVLGMLDASPHANRVNPYRDAPKVITIPDDDAAPKALPAPPLAKKQRPKT
jgi:transcriptional regulator with XRE-family HTH domain